ncbi:MAG: EamA family transporter [Halobacteriovorax sp.]|nr:EamA family transporter [Halobacteriovorax sp.]
MKGIFFIVIACLLWALDTLIRYPLLFSGTNAEMIVFAEHLILTLVFFPALYRSRARLLTINPKHIFYFLIVGGLGSAIATVTFTKAFGIINPSLVILLQKLQPIVAIILSYYVLKESMKPQFFLWALLALVGGFMISFQDLMPAFKLIAKNEFSFSIVALKGYALTIISVVGWASATVFGKLLSKKGYGEVDIMSLRFLMGLLCMMPFVLSFNVEFNFGIDFWSKIILLALFSGALGMYFYYKGLKRIPAHLCTLAELFFPFFAVAVNWIFLGKELSFLQIFGGLLVLLSSTVIQSKHL